MLHSDVNVGFFYYYYFTVVQLQLSAFSPHPSPPPQPNPPPSSIHQRAGFGWIETVIWQELINLEVGTPVVRLAKLKHFYTLFTTKAHNYLPYPNM